MTKQKQIELHLRQIEDLRANIASAEEDSAANLKSAKEWKALSEEREKIETDLRRKLTDLKERLATSELENARMRGYIERAQEDDTVREELIAVEDENGKRMVPKRKPTTFVQQDQYKDMTECSDTLWLRQQQKPDRKHWVTY